ncbi:MAG: RNA polymerase sigma factor RpoD/SigA [Treponema sp.]|nr:RNA polymerase sigma factor RpoD/SigA [Treponema sp.]
MTKKKGKKMIDSKMSGKDEGNSFFSYLQEVNRIPLLSKEEELETAKLAAGGNKAAAEKLVTSNLRFVIMVAKKYQGKGLPLQDMISEGNMGLLNAAKHFDAEKGYRFITYAVWWVRQAIIKAIHEKGRMIRLPSHKSRELARAERSLELNDKDMGYCGSDVLSLDEPISFDTSATIKDFIQDELENSPIEHAANSILKEELEAILNTLEERSAEVLRCRYGLGGMAPMTLSEVGDRYQLSRERIRQIENRAILQLETSSREHKLDSYIA